MQQEKKKSINTKPIYLVIGILLIIGTLAGGNLSSITNWSTGELIGYNLWTIFAIGGGAILVYLGIKK